MTTPSSSATSPSPPLAYLQAPSPASQPSPPLLASSTENDTRKKAVQKFVARAELSSVTRALRARLSYANFKATNHGSNITADNQAHLQALSMPFARGNTLKRKAPGTNNYYNNPATQPSASASLVSSQRRSTTTPSSGPAAGSRSHNPVPNGSAPALNGDPSSSRYPAQTLFTSILAPPPAKQARTILNANDPPVAAPARPPSSYEVGKVVRSIAEGTRAHAKSRASPRSPDKRNGKRVSDKKKRKTDDRDVKAAAALTSLLLRNRPSVASTISPRSSVDGSESHPTSRNTIGPGPDTTHRNATPPILHSGAITPHPPQPSDNEAADLMLFLATSPSPARPGNKEAKDLAAYRTFSGTPNSLRAKGRVLFPSNTIDGQGEETAGKPPPRIGSALARGTESSFNSSISSITSDMNPRRPPVESNAPLLPPAALPTSVPQPNSPSGFRRIQSPRPNANVPQSPDFNFNEYINASPTRGSGPKMNLGLRADVGRRLFAEEQMREQMRLGYPDGQQPGGKRMPDDRGLNAGMDPLKS